MSTFADMANTLTGQPAGAPVTQSPFGQPAGAPVTANMFAQPDLSAPGGKFTKLHTMEDQLILVAPLRIESVTKYRSEEREDALIASLVILTGEAAGTEIKEWQVTSSKLVRIGKAALAASQQFVLGRVVMIPTWDSVKNGEFAEDDTEGIKKAIAQWAANGARGVKPTFAWTLARFTPEDAEIATAYLKK